MKMLRDQTFDCLASPFNFGSQYPAGPKIKLRLSRQANACRRTSNNESSCLEPRQRTFACGSTISRDWSRTLTDTLVSDRRWWCPGRAYGFGISRTTRGTGCCGLRRSSASVVTWRRAQIVLLIAALHSGGITCLSLRKEGM